MKNCFYLLCLVLIVVTPTVQSNSNEKPSKLDQLLHTFRNLKNSYSGLNQDLLSIIKGSNNPKILKSNNTIKQNRTLEKPPKTNLHLAKASDVKKPNNGALKVKFVDKKPKEKPHNLKPSMPITKKSQEKKPEEKKSEDKKPKDKKHQEKKHKGKKHEHKQQSSKNHKKTKHLKKKEISKPKKSLNNAKKHPVVTKRSLQKNETTDEPTVPQSDDPKPDDSGKKEPNPDDRIGEQTNWQRWPIGIIMILLGFPIGLKGFVWFTPWQCVPLGILSGLEVNHWIFASANQYYELSGAGWKIFFLLQLIVLTVGFASIFRLLETYGAALLFAYFSMLLGNLLVSIINSQVVIAMDTWIGLVVVLSLFLIGFFVGLYFGKLITVFGTAFVGAYNILAGIGMMACQFPIRDSNIGKWVFWVYFLFMTIAFIGMLFYQYNDINKKQELSAEKAYGIEINLETEA